MQLAILAAVLAALAAGEAGQANPVSGVPWRLALCLGMALVAPAAALTGTQRLVGGLLTPGEASLRERRLAHLQARVMGLWLAGALGMLFVAGWPQIVRGNWALSAWPLVDELAVLLPILAPLLLIWALFYRLERSAQVLVFRLRGLTPPPSALFRFLWLQVRLHLGLVVLPALAVIAVHEVLSATRLDLPSGAAALWIGIPTVGLLLFFMPLVVRKIWRTSPLPPGNLRAELSALCRERRCPVQDILVWHTDEYVGNAAVVGLSRWLRYVFLTDGLLSRLSTIQIAAVMRHELAHLTRRHVPMRLALLALPVVWWGAIEAAWPNTGEVLAQRVAGLGLSSELTFTMGVPLAMLAYALVVVGWYSRLLEHDADLEACQDAAGEIQTPRAANLVAALEELLGNTPESRLALWLHPSLAARAAFLERAQRQPDFAARFRTRLRSIAMAIGGLYLAAAALAAFG